ncbi:membrane cofactor protein-like [Leptodactylus fuscus]|uniref:membrane cofactor protein-like n=1 Tax=Leptodactylus fuscus TaxID=238119 RepID=UPI003F4E456F
MGYYWIIVLIPAFFGSSHGFCGPPPWLEFAELNEAFLNRDNFTIGENVTYKCRPGFKRDPGTNILTCLSNSTWSVPDTFCTRQSCGHPKSISNGQVSLTDTLFGSKAVYTCDPGYNMISKKNYLECQADGQWSNDPPACEVQLCPPPYAIPDGTFSPDKDDYQYQDAVTYTCVNSTLVLIGEVSISCTAHGNWSSDPPKCKVVQCSTPEVKNSEKESGFTGPYNHNSGVRFKCLPGFTMEGSPSVKCNSSSEWEPALPTCNRIEAERPPNTTETGGSTVTQVPSTTPKENGNNGGSTVTQTTTKQPTGNENGGEGSNVGAVVGGVISGIVGILIAASAIIYVCWFKKKKGGGYIGPTGKNPDSGTSSSHQTPIEQCDMQQIGAQETP